MRKLSPSPQAVFSKVQLGNDCKGFCASAGMRERSSRNSVNKGMKLWVSNDG